MGKIKFLTSLLAIFLWLAVCAPCFGENPWSIRINIPEFKLYLYHAKEVYQTFYVAVGKQDTPSPLGEFWIANKVLNPTWYPTDGRAPVPAGPDNPLGKYWLGLNVEGYGIHGNSAAWTIGTPASLGCFRLHNRDIQKLFQMVPVGTPVQIVYKTVHAEVDNNNTVWLDAYPDIYQWDNLELEISKALSGLCWTYEPHWRALGELLQAKKPLKIEVPRTIKVEGESFDIDGFFWQQEVYIAQKVIETAHINLRTTNTGKFNGYVKLETGRFTGEEPQYYWDSEANTLRIIRLKVLLNGMELSDAAIWAKEKQALINVKLVSDQLGSGFFWDYVSKTAICNGVMVEGEPRKGIFWLPPEQLQLIWPKIKYHWRERGTILELRIE